LLETVCEHAQTVIKSMQLTPPTFRLYDLDLWAFWPKIIPTRQESTSMTSHYQIWWI